jgi:tRNA(fMet)-specific endonuclease VapC
VLNDLEMVPFDRDAALEAATIQVELEAKGALIGPMDLLIAGIARRHRATLVTNNRKEFQRVKDLKIVDWRACGG